MCASSFTFAPRVKQQVEADFILFIHNLSVRRHHQHSKTVLADEGVCWTVQSQQQFILGPLLVKPPPVSGSTLSLDLDHRLVSFT